MFFLSMVPRDRDTSEVLSRLSLAATSESSALCLPPIYHTCMAAGSQRFQF